MTRITERIETDTPISAPQLQSEHEPHCGAEIVCLGAGNGQFPALFLYSVEFFPGLSRRIGLTASGPEFSVVENAIATGLIMPDIVGAHCFYLKVSAVNFDTTIGDSNDLSTIRGSSLALLRMPRALQALLEALVGDVWSEAGIEVSTLYASASELVMRFRTAAGTLPAEFFALCPPSKKLGAHDWEEFVAETAEALEKTPNPKALFQSRTRNWTEDHPPTGRDRLDRPRLEQALKLWAKRPQSRPMPDDFVARLSAEVRGFLSKGVRRYLSFSHAILAPKPGWNLADILSALDAELNGSKYRSLSLPLPEPGLEGVGYDRAFCSVTLQKRPAQRVDDAKAGAISESAFQRRKEGRVNRDRFYEDQIAVAREAASACGMKDEGIALPSAHGDLALASSFQDMINPEKVRGLSPSLAGKVAVIYMDGNGFNKRRMGLAGAGSEEAGFAAFRHFSDKVEAQAGRLLSAILAFASSARGMRGVDDCLALETLLWGGDEMCFVLPAHQALDFLEVVQSEISGWSDAQAKPQRLSFALGVVFAPAKSPIRELRRAAERLCEAVKREQGINVNKVQMLALEGIDRANLDPFDLRQELFGAACPAASDFSMDMKDLADIRALVRDVRAGIGLSQLHGWWLRAEQDVVIGAVGNAADVLVGKMVKRVSDVGGVAVEDPMARLSSPLLAQGHGRAPLLPLYHLLSLADYIDVVADPGAVGGPGGDPAVEGCAA